MHARGLWLAVIVAVAMSGCTGGHHTPHPGPTSSDRPSPVPAPRLVVTRVASFDLATGATSLTVLDGGRVAYSTGGDDPTQRLEVFDPATGRSSVVAHTAYPRGEIDSVVGSGDHLVWVDQSAPAGDGDVTARWTMYSLDLTAGTRAVLGTSGSRPSPDVPLPEVNDGLLAWSMPAPTDLRFSELHLLDLATGRLLVRRVAAVFQVVPALGYVVGLVPRGTGLDIMAFAMPGGPAKPLTDGGTPDTFLAAGGSRVAWTESDPTTEVQAPVRIMVDDLADAGAPIVAVPVPNEGEPAVGGGFLAYVGADSRVTVTGFDGRTAPVTVGDADTGASLAAADDLLAYSELVGGSGAVRVFLDRITASGAA